MSDYRVNWDDLSSDSKKWLKRQTQVVQNTIDDCISIIAGCPRGKRPTYGHLQAEYYCNWRYRVNDVRIIYGINDRHSVLRIQRIGPRHNVYK